MTAWYTWVHANKRLLFAWRAICAYLICTDLSVMVTVKSMQQLAPSGIAIMSDSQAYNSVPAGISYLLQRTLNPATYSTLFHIDVDMVHCFLLFFLDEKSSFEANHICIADGHREYIRVIITSSLILHYHITQFGMT